MSSLGVVAAYGDQPGRSRRAAGGEGRALPDKPHCRIFGIRIRHQHESVCQAREQVEGEKRWFLAVEAPKPGCGARDPNTATAADALQEAGRSLGFDDDELETFAPAIPQIAGGGGEPPTPAWTKTCVAGPPARCSRDR